MEPQVRKKEETTLFTLFRFLPGSRALHFVCPDMAHGVGIAASASRKREATSMALQRSLKHGCVSPLQRVFIDHEKKKCKSRLEAADTCKPTCTHGAPPLSQVLVRVALPGTVCGAQRVRGVGLALAPRRHPPGLGSARMWGHPRAGPLSGAGEMRFWRRAGLAPCSPGHAPPGHVLNPSRSHHSAHLSQQLCPGPVGEAWPEQEQPLRVLRPSPWAAPCPWAWASGA